MAEYTSSPVPLEDLTQERARSYDNIPTSRLGDEGVETFPGISTSSYAQTPLHPLVPTLPQSGLEGSVPSPPPLVTPSMNHASIERSLIETRQLLNQLTQRLDYYESGYSVPAPQSPEVTVLPPRRDRRRYQTYGNRTAHERPYEGAPWEETRHWPHPNMTGHSRPQRPASATAASPPPPMTSHPDAAQQYAYPGIGNRYYSAPAAVGLGINTFRPNPNWSPEWNHFLLRTYRGADSTSLIIYPDWDDERLLRGISRHYDKLRSWRKYLSLKTFRSLALVLADDNFVYPQFRIKTADPNLHQSRDLRIRHYIANPEILRGKREFMEYLTMDSECGIVFLERWNPYRISLLILIPVMLTLVFTILWSYFTGNVGDAFTIGSYMVGAYSACLVLVGILNWVEF